MLSPLRKVDPDWFIFDWKQMIVRRWAPGESVAPDVVRRPSVPCGFVMKAGIGGETGGLEPAWPSVAGATVVDGSVTWTAVVWTDSVVPLINSCTYSVTPSGISQPSTAIDQNQKRTRVRLDASAAAVGTYTITATMTDNFAEQYVVSEEIEVIP